MVQISPKLEGTSDVSHLCAALEGKEHKRKSPANVEHSWVPFL
jgi:hypothetical protein